MVEIHDDFDRFSPQARVVVIYTVELTFVRFKRALSRIYDNKTAGRRLWANAHLEISGLDVVRSVRAQ